MSRRPDDGSDSDQYVATISIAELLREAIAIRAVIEQAKGMLMMLHNCDADEAFDHLVRASQDSGQSVRDIAADFVSAASAPGSRPPPPPPGRPPGRARPTPSSPPAAVRHLRSVPSIDGR